MKKVLLVLVVCLFIISCGNRETVDIESIEFDTLRVKVLIFSGDTLVGTIGVDE